MNLKDILNKLKESGVDLKLVGEIAKAFNYSYISGYEDSKKDNVKLNNQSCFCYCPNCNNELCGTNSFISDIDGIVTYECSKCGEVSKFDFSIAPVPILIGKEE